MTKFKLVQIVVSGDRGTAGLLGQENFVVAAVGRFPESASSKLWAGTYRLRPGEKLAVIKELPTEPENVVEE